MKNNIKLTKKSIMYKIISLGYSIYIHDNDDIIVSALICSNCKNLWLMSRSECIFCGFENPHIYKCRKCGEYYSITRSSKKCCNKPLSKVCINEKCLTNTNKVLKNYFDNLGGVFNINSSGATLNEMRCKKCGHRENEYRSMMIQVVDRFNKKMNKEVCYIRKESDNKFEVNYKGKKKTYKTIENLIYINLIVDCD